MTTMYAREAVDRGIDILDREIPGWRGKINIKKMNVSNVNRCILAQVFKGEGGFMGGLRFLKISYAYEYGFGLNPDHTFSHDDLMGEWLARL